MDVAAQDPQRQDRAPHAAGPGVGRADRRHLHRDERLNAETRGPQAAARNPQERPMDELKQAILDYVKKEYLEEDDDRDHQRGLAADHRRHRGLLLDGLAQALPGAEVRDPDPGRRGQPGGLRHRQQHRRAGHAASSRRAAADRSVMAVQRIARALPDRARRASASRAVQGGALHPLAAGRRHRGRVPGRRGGHEGHQPLRQQLPRPLQPPRGRRGRARGARPPRLRHVVGALHLRHPGHPPRARAEADRVPRHRGHAALPLLHGRQRRRVRGRPRRAGRDDRRPAGARLDRGRHAAVQGDARTPTSTPTWRTSRRSSRSTRTSASA